VSKIVSWGHWLLALFSAILGLYSLAAFVFAVVMSRTLWQSGSSEHSAFVFVGVNLVAWLPLLLCAWGILKLRAWGYMLAIIACGFAILTELETLVFFGFTRIRASEIAKFTAACLVVAWLLLPSVRAAYWDRERIA
jgi:hypothetical protein